MNGRSVAPKIGVFDSGVGGLSVLREIHRLLPGHPTCYAADQAHLPYGQRTHQEILEYVDAITRFLSAQGARVIVLACHAASAASLQPLRERYPDLTFVGIEPAVKPAAEQTRTGVVGVLTTQATADGALYRSVLERFAGDVTVLTRVSPDLVLLVEAGRQDTPEGRALVRQHVEPLIEAGIDHLVLACTHFPFLADSIREAARDAVTLVDPAPAVARQTARVWPQALAPAPEANTYYTTGDPDRFRAMLRRLINVDAPVTHLNGIPD